MGKSILITLIYVFYLSTICFGQKFVGANVGVHSKLGLGSLTKKNPDEKMHYFFKQKSKKNFIKAIPTSDKFYIDFVGSGDIQKSASEGKDINANTGLGVILERFSGYYKVVQSFELEATINIATTADSINAIISNQSIQNQRDFGTYILNPISTKQALFINSNVYFGYPDKNNKGDTQKSNNDKKTFAKFAKIVSGVNFRVISSNSVWSVDNSSRNLGVIYFRGGIFHEFIPDNYRLGEKGNSDEGRSKYSLFFGVNYSYRGIIGDISSDNNIDLRKKVLGTHKTSFKGFEMNFGFRLNNLRAEFQMPLLNGGSESIEGLTNSQFLFSIKFVGGFTLKLNSSDLSEDNK